MALAALHEGHVQANERIASQGYMARTASGGFILRDHMPAGNHDLVDSLAQSSNVVFAKLARRLTPEVWPNGTVAWAWGASLPQMCHGSGRIGAGSSYPQAVASGLYWFLGIGQNISSSPLRVVTIPALVATGSIVTPHLVRGAAPRPGRKTSHQNIYALFSRVWRRSPAAAAPPEAAARSTVGSY